MSDLLYYDMFIRIKCGLMKGYDNTILISYYLILVILNIKVHTCPMNCIMKCTVYSCLVWFDEKVC